MDQKTEFCGAGLQPQPPAQEPERQYYFIERCRRHTEEFVKRHGRKPKACVFNMGCQMNARDSEKLSGILASAGYELSDSEEADLVVYNTCTVRENANNKVWGRLGYLNAYKKKHPHMKIALSVCGSGVRDA